MTDHLEPDCILVAVDGSAHAERAARWAAETARLERRPLVVVTVDGDTSETSRRVAHDLGRADADLDVRARTITGEPRQALLELTPDARMLVVGSRGRGALASALLGSVSASLAAAASCPVVVCRPRSDGAPRRGVLVGADGTAESLPVIGFAYRQAALRHLSLTVLHCFWDAVAAVAEYRVSRGQAADAPELDDLRSVVAQSLAGLAEEYPDVPVAISLKHGLVDEALSPRNDGWDLVVVGRHPMTSLARVLTGSVATTVVERSPTTVAVVPEERPTP